jgi:hypothetical protein
MAALTHVLIDLSTCHGSDTPFGDGGRIRPGMCGKCHCYEQEKIAHVLRPNSQKFFGSFFQKRTLPSFTQTQQRADAIA